jgi:hypothetical protein
MPKRQYEWKRQAKEVVWADVWAWADDLWAERQISVEVKLNPPAGAASAPHGSLQVVLSSNVPGVGYVPRALKWSNIPDPTKASAASVALRLLLDIIREYPPTIAEAERATAEARDRLW